MRSTFMRPIMNLPGTQVAWLIHGRTLCQSPDTRVTTQFGDTSKGALEVLLPVLRLSEELKKPRLANDYLERRGAGHRTHHWKMAESSSQS
jgi:hypothetical protein